MDRSEIINQVKRYFNIKELVCDHTYARYGERAWQFMDTDFLHCLLILRRDIFKVPMVCNYRGHFQRGLRCNQCAIVKVDHRNTLYLSAHVLGKAGDFTVEGIPAEQARNMIKENAMKFPCNVRIEEGVSWLHFDVLPQYGITSRVYGFRA